MKYEDKIYEEHKSKTCIVYLYLLLAERGICMDRKVWLLVQNCPSTGCWCCGSINSIGVQLK